MVGALGLAFLAGCGTASMPGIEQAQTLKFASAAVTQNLVAQYGRGLGWISRGTAPIVDDLDQVSLPAFNVQDASASLPTHVDLRPFMSPIADQGELGSCTAFASVKGIGEFRELQHLRLAGASSSAFVPLSAGYLYFEEREFMGTTSQDSGGQVFLAMEDLAGGVPPEAAYPYPTPSQQRDPWFMKYWLQATPSEAVNIASERYAGGRLEAVTKLSELKQELAAGNPVAFGFDIFQEWYETGSTHIPVPNVNDPIVGGHAVVAVGYDDATQEIIIRNSWGTGIGDQGYFYMPYKYFDAQLGLADDGWALTD